LRKNTEIKRCVEIYCNVKELWTESYEEFSRGNYDAMIAKFRLMEKYLDELGRLGCTKEIHEDIKASLETIEKAAKLGNYERVQELRALVSPRIREILDEILKS